MVVVVVVVVGPLVSGKCRSGDYYNLARCFLLEMFGKPFPLMFWERSSPMTLVYISRP